MSVNQSVTYVHELDQGWHSAHAQIIFSVVSISVVHLCNNADEKVKKV
jgi:hypothetical protein